MLFDVDDVMHAALLAVAIIPIGLKSPKERVQLGCEESVPGAARCP